MKTSIPISFREAKSIITKSKLPDADYVINPYLGCPHGCIYCYAEFMKRFSKHSEPWGAFLEIKQVAGEVNFRTVRPDETILIGSVTDAYNPYEAKYGVTRDLLSKMTSCAARVEILTKSKLVCRDVDLLLSIPHVAVGISLNTIDDGFRRRIEPFASTVSDRITALRTLHEAGIETYLFVAPFFPGITDALQLLRRTAGYVNYVCFENLNLRGSYRTRVLSMISNEFPNHLQLYDRIYNGKYYDYWDEKEHELKQLCSEMQIPCRIYFHHGSPKKKTEEM